MPRTRASGRSLKGLLRGSRGMATIEYILILVVLALGAIAAWRALGMSVRSQGSTSAESISNLDGTVRGGTSHGGTTGGGTAHAGAGPAAAGAGDPAHGGAGGEHGGGGGEAQGAGGGGGEHGGAAGSTGAGGSAGTANSGSGGGGAGGGAAQAQGARQASQYDNSVYHNVQYEQDLRLYENRRMILWGVVLLCVLLVVWIGVRNVMEYRKAKEEAQKRADAQAKAASMDLSAFDLPSAGGAGGGGGFAGGLSGESSSFGDAGPGGA